MGALRGGHGMGDLLSGIETGISNEVNTAPTQLLSGLASSVAAQPGVVTAAGTAAKGQAANAIAAQIVTIMNNPVQLALYAGGFILGVVILAKVIK